MDTLVVFALPFEAGEFCRRNGNASVFVAKACGMNAIEAFRKHLDAMPAPPRRVVWAGFAGALDPSLPVGEVFVVQRREKSKGAPLRGKEGRDDCLAGTDVSKDQLFSLNSSLLTRKLATIDFIADVAEKRKHFETTGSAACDMEHAHAQEICSERGIEFLGIRVISDDAETPLPLPPMLFLALLEEHLSSLPPIVYLLTHPWKWLAFARLAGECRLARRNLTRALEKILQLPSLM